MINVSLEELNAGQVLARTVYRASGEILLNAGYRITDEVRQRLQGMGQNLFWVQEEGLEDVLPDELIEETITHQCADELRQCAQSLRNSFSPRNKSKDNNLTFPRPDQILQNIASYKESVQPRKLRQIARTLFVELRKINNPLLYFNTSRNSANWLYQNAVDAALVAAILGRRFAFSDNELEDLIFGVLVMDIGYQLLPSDLLEKNGRLNFQEFSLLKEHPTFGYEILRNEPLVPLICAHIALQHHERQDGGGFPRRLRGQNLPPVKSATTEKNIIHRYAEIAAVADEYMNMAQPRLGLPLTPLQRIRHLLQASGSRLNSSIVDMIIPLVPLFSSGQRVRIIQDSNSEFTGFTALVTKVNRTRQDRPEIALLYDDHGNRVKPKRLNLEESQGISITEI